VLKVSTGHGGAFEAVGVFVAKGEVFLLLEEVVGLGRRVAGGDRADG